MEALACAESFATWRRGEWYLYAYLQDNANVGSQHLGLPHRHHSDRIPIHEGCRHSLPHLLPRPHGSFAMATSHALSW
jgi:hypothetical protein